MTTARRGAEGRAERRAFARWRPFARLMVVAAAWSCASAGMPPGGPEDFESPAVLRVRPDTNALNVRPGGAVTYNFDKVVSERPQGAPDLAGLFLISPSFGAPSISWRRNQVSVKPRGGFKPATTYTVRMLPGLTDLQGNADSVGRTLVFSTGPSIATGAVRGIIFDWLAEKSAPQAVIEAFPLPTPRDSSRYLAIADSTGRFELGQMPPGRYLLRGSIDQNKNRIVDPREFFDTATITLADSVRREILAYVHDTIGAGIQTVSIADSLTLRVTLDRALDTTFVIDTSQFTLKRRVDKSPDSVEVRIVQALSRKAYDQAREDSLRTKAVQDSIQKAAAADSAAAADTAAKPPAPPQPQPTRRAPPARRAIEQVAEALAGRDTTPEEPPPKPSLPAPVNEIVLKLEAPLLPSTSYRLRAIEMRTLLGYARSSERVITTPKERKPPPDSTAKDTTQAARDSTAVRDTAALRDTAAVRDTAAARDTVPPVDTIGVAARPRRQGAAGARASRLPWSPLLQPRRATAEVRRTGR